MKAVPDQPGSPEAVLAAAQARIRQLEGELVEAMQELQAASDIISEQEVSLECLRLQLEAADLVIEEAAEARRKLERRMADLEDAGTDNPCPVVVPVTKDHADPPQPGYPPLPLVEAMTGQFRSRERK